MTLLEAYKIMNFKTVNVEGIDYCAVTIKRNGLKTEYIKDLYCKGIDDLITTHDESADFNLFDKIADDWIIASHWDGKDRLIDCYQ